MSNSSKKKEWWQSVFDDKYLKTYVDIATPELTKLQISFLQKNLKLKSGTQILDLACGYGRHAIELAKLGYKVTGFDFSKHFIKLAKEKAEKEKVKVNFIQGDMRKLSFVNKFDAVINMFTSFGYFDDEKDNTIVLKKIYRALRPKGVLLMDLNNMTRTLARIQTGGEIDPGTKLLTKTHKGKQSSGLVVTTRHKFDAQTLRWFMTRTWKEKGREKKYRTSLRMFSLPELRHLMEENGLHIEKVWGDFKGSRYSFDSPRMIVLAKKS